MTNTYQDYLSQLFREIEIDQGTTNLSVLVLDSFANAVEELKGQNTHHFFIELIELVHTIQNTEPKFAIIIDAFYEILKLAYDEEIHHVNEDFPLRKKKFLSKLRKLINKKQQEEKQLTQNALTSISVEGREILIHDNSHTIQRVLAAFRGRGDHFRVIVAEQDPDKTGPIIESLHKNDIAFRVVPAYMVTHLEQHIDMVFFGGVTFKSTMDFVMDPGTNALVSQFYLMKKPMYLFMATTKFSMWKSKKRTEVYIHVHRRKHHAKSIDFERIKFSHDRVPARYFKKIITEQGAFTPRGIEDFYSKKLKERLKSDTEFEKQVKKIAQLSK